VNHEGLVEWLHANADGVARRFVAKDPELADRIVRRLEAEQGVGEVADETWRRYFVATHGFEPAA
jgi:hypothetical protein